jgi:hypothetical protein
MNLCLSRQSLAWHSKQGFSNFVARSVTSHLNLKCTEGTKFMCSGAFGQSMHTIPRRRRSGGLYAWIDQMHRLDFPLLDRFRVGDTLKERTLPELVDLRQLLCSAL